MSKPLKRKKTDILLENECTSYISIIKTHSIPILIFLTTLFVLLLINRPAIYLNDEFITVNQLHQLSLGHQTLINECKYGCYPNGTPTLYFENKNNILGYTLFLPIISLPALHFFGLFQDQFRLPIILFWSIIPILLTIFLSIGYPQYARVKGFPLLYIGATISILLLMINLYYYHPFPFTPVDAPSESGAIVLTNTIIGSLMSVVFYLIGLLLWKDKKASLLCTIAILSCSSYLFWSGTAKDHVLMTFVLTLVTYFFISSIIKEKRFHRWVGFFFIGLLAWVRPEVGLSVFFGALLYQGIEWFLERNRMNQFYQTLKNTLICIGATGLGSLPLFINNFITTNNILIPPFYYYLAKNFFTSEILIKESAPMTLIEGITLTSSVGGSVSILKIPSLLISYFFSTSPVVIIKSIFSIIFYPESGNMSLFAVTPLFFTGIVILIIYLLHKKPELGTHDVRIILLLSILIIVVFTAYTRSLPGISKSSGIVPDMRYFLPFYFIGGYLGFYPLAKWGQKIIDQVVTVRKIVFFLTFLIFLTFLLVLMMPKASYHEYTSLYMLLVYSASLLFITSFFAAKKGIIPYLIPAILFLVLISLPLSWQLLMDLFYSLGKAHGYPPWMPYLEYLTEKYVQYEVLK